MTVYYYDLKFDTWVPIPYNISSLFSKFNPIKANYYGTAIAITI